MLRWLLFRKVHSCWAIMILAISFCIGDWLGVYFQISLWMLILAIISAMTLLFIGRRILLMPVLVIAGIIMGIGQTSHWNKQASLIRNYHGQEISIAGYVKSDSTYRSDTELGLKLNQLKVDNKAIDLTIWVSLETNESIQRGDLIYIKGKLSDGFASFAGAVYEAELVEVIQPSSLIGLRFRDWFSSQVAKVIDGENLSLALGFLLGQQTELSPEMSEALRIIGLTHIVVASGYNLTVLIRLSRRLLAPTSKYLALVSSLGLVIGFISVTGFSPSMVRAGLVALLSLLAWYYGRKFHPLILISVVGAITLTIDPIYIWGDLGWQLSFLAFFGVMILAPLLNKYFFGTNKPKLVGQLVMETLAAQIMTLPIILFNFGQISVISVFANLLVVPLIPLVMLVTFAVGLLSSIYLGLAKIVGLLANGLLDYIVKVIYLLPKLLWSIVEIELSSLMMSVIYLVISIICIYLWQKTKLNLSDVNLIE